MSHTFVRLIWGFVAEKLFCPNTVNNLNHSYINTLISDIDFQMKHTWKMTTASYDGTVWCSQMWQRFRAPRKANSLPGHAWFYALRDVKTAALNSLCIRLKSYPVESPGGKPPTNPCFPKQLAFRRNAVSKYDKKKMMKNHILKAFDFSRVSRGKTSSMQTWEGSGY